jgi:hypothetical protein
MADQTDYADWEQFEIMRGSVSAAFHFGFKPGLRGGAQFVALPRF